MAGRQTSSPPRYLKERFQVPSLTTIRPLPRSSFQEPAGRSCSTSHDQTRSRTFSPASDAMYRTAEDLRAEVTRGSDWILPMSKW